MTTPVPGTRLRSAAISRFLHPIGMPVGLAVLAVALLGGVAWVAVNGGNDTVQKEAQVRARSNRDAAVRALVRQTDDFKREVATWSADPAVIGGLGRPTPAGLSRAEDQLSILARSQESPAAFLTDNQGRNVVIYPSQPELLGKSFSFRDWLKGADRTGRPEVS